MMKFFFLTVVCFFSSALIAEEAIKSIRSVMHMNNKMYVSSAREDNKTINANKLNALWQAKQEILFTDKYQQEWKQVDITELSFNEGSDAKDMLLYFGKEFHFVKPKSAALFKWGCDYSVVPVLNLGKWPFAVRAGEWNGMTIEIDPKYGMPIVNSNNTDKLQAIPAIAKSIKHNICTTTDSGITTKSLCGYSAIELKWKKLPKLKVLYLIYNDPRADTHELIIYNTETKKVRVLEKKSPFDILC